MMPVNPWAPIKRRPGFDPETGIVTQRKRVTHIVEPICPVAAYSRDPVHIDQAVHDMKRSDLLMAQKVMLFVLSIYPDGLTTMELMHAMGIAGRNRKQLQRTRDWLVHVGEVIADKAPHPATGKGAVKIYRRKQ